MMLDHLLRTCRRLGMAAACLAGVAGPAQAGLISGVFDPAFGAPFTGLGWKGEVVFDVPNACLALGSASFANPECQGSSMVSASVTLYDLANPGNVDVLDFYGSALRLTLLDVTVASGAVTGISTMLLKAPFGPSDNAFPNNWLFPGGTLPSPVIPQYAAYRYGLSISGNTATLSAAAQDLVAATGGGYLDPLLGCPYDGDYAICRSETSPQVTYTVVPPTTVPEPGALLLVGAALAAAGGASRLKRRQPAA